MTDDREKDLIGETLDAALRGDTELAEGFSRTLNQHHAENPKADDGKYRISFGDGTVRQTEPGETTCPDCGSTVRWGPGIAFYAEDDPRIGPEDQMHIASHHTRNCSARPWRWYRFKRDRLGGGWAERRSHRWARNPTWKRTIARAWMWTLRMNHWPDGD